jgi:hypothetical protein
MLLFVGEHGIPGQGCVPKSCGFVVRWRRGQREEEGERNVLFGAGGRSDVGTLPDYMYISSRKIHG